MEELQSAQFNDEDDNEFYEKIEAPKFVDFTVPDLSRPDDRSWFCLRIGCDQKHEEDMDPDALYRTFVLRVMAARSPNLRLQKALSRQTSRANIKCPLSAPAKSSKGRMSRLTTITSVSQKMPDTKLKVHPISKLNLTPNVKAKQSSVAGKALTTRYKKCVASPDPFRSVQNPKTVASVPKNRVVAKALVFHTPKKNERMNLLQSHIPVTEISEGMKKLEITSKRNHVLGHSRIIPSRYNTCHRNKSVPASDTSKTCLSAKKVKSRAEVSFVSQDCKGQVVKSSRSLKSKTKRNLQKCNGSVSREVIDGESSDMDIDRKSRDGSLELCSILGRTTNNEEKGHEEDLISVKTSANLSSMAATQEESFPSTESSTIRENLFSASTDASSCKASSLSNSEEEKKLEENDSPKVQALKGEGYKTNKGSDHEENIGSNSEEGKDSEDLPLHQTSKREEDMNEATESDNKENDLASDDNREMNLHNVRCERKILSKHESPDKSQKVTRVLGRTFKECSASAATGAQGVKYKKTKPTNPRPFRLRTDERGILKEANLDRRFHLFAPSKETATVLRFPTGSSLRKHGNETQQNEKSRGQHDNHTHKGYQTESEKRLPRFPTRSSQRRHGYETQQQLRPAYLKASKCAAGTKMDPIIRKRLVEDGREKKAVRKTESRSKTAKLTLLQPQRMASANKARVSLTPFSQLSTIKETSSTISQPKEVAEQIKSSAINSFTAAARSSSRGRRPATTPKEPNIHSIHVPKSCTKKLIKAVPS